MFVFIFETTTEEAFTQILFDLFEIPSLAVLEAGSTQNGIVLQIDDE